MCHRLKIHAFLSLLILALSVDLYSQVPYWYCACTDNRSTYAGAQRVSIQSLTKSNIQTLELRVDNLNLTTGRLDITSGGQTIEYRVTRNLNDTSVIIQPVVNLFNGKSDTARLQFYGSTSKVRNPSVTFGTVRVRRSEQKGGEFAFDLACNLWCNPPGRGPVPELPVYKVIEKHLISKRVIITDNLMRMIYDLNPQLRGAQSIPANASIRYPKFTWVSCGLKKRYKKAHKLAIQPNADTAKLFNKRYLDFRNALSQYQSPKNFANSNTEIARQKDSLAIIHERLRKLDSASNRVSMTAFSLLNKEVLHITALMNQCNGKRSVSRPEFEQINEMITDIDYSTSRFFIYRPIRNITPGDFRLQPIRTRTGRQSAFTYEMETEGPGLSKVYAEEEPVLVPRPNEIPVYVYIYGQLANGEADPQPMKGFRVYYRPNGTANDPRTQTDAGTASTGGCSLANSYLVFFIRGNGIYKRTRMKVDVAKINEYMKSKKAFRLAFYLDTDMENATN